MVHKRKSPNFHVHVRTIEYVLDEKPNHYLASDDTVGHQTSRQQPGVQAIFVRVIRCNRTKQIGLLDLLPNALPDLVSFVTRKTLRHLLVFAVAVSITLYQVHYIRNGYDRQKTRYANIIEYNNTLNTRIKITITNRQWIADRKFSTKNKQQTNVLVYIPKLYVNIIGRKRRLPKN